MNIERQERPLWVAQNQLFWNCLWTLVIRISDLTDFRPTDRQSQNFNFFKSTVRKIEFSGLIRVGYQTSKTSNLSKVSIKCVHQLPRFWICEVYFFTSQNSQNASKRAISWLVCGYLGWVRDHVRTYPRFHIIDFSNKRFMSFQSSFSFWWVRWILDWNSGSKKH